MNAENLVKLIEEMIELKLPNQVDPNLKNNPEIARLLAEKRHADSRRLELIRAELIRVIGEGH